MNKKFERGMILKLHEDTDKQYVIINELIKENEQYLLLNPFIDDDESEEIEILVDIEKMVLIKINQNLGDFEYVTDLNKTKEIVSEILKSEEIL